MSSHSSKSLKSEVKSLKSLLKQLTKDIQSISSKQLENEIKTNELTKAKNEKSQFSKKLHSHASSSKHHDYLGEESLRKNEYHQQFPRRARKERQENLTKHISHTQAREIPCLEYLGNDQLASQCFNERSMILRDKDENSSQEKEASESEENVKIEKQEKTLGKQKAWEKSVPSHKVIQQEGKVENTFEDIPLVAQPSLTFCKGTLASLEKKEESLKKACIDKNIVDYFTYMPRYHQVKVKSSIGIYKVNFLCEVVPKETCHVLLRQPLQRIEISMNKVCNNETTFTHKREILHEGELMGKIRVDKTLELLKGKLLSPMRKDVQRHYLRYIPCFKNTSKAMSHELYTPSPFANDPWEDISLNFILDLPRTIKGFDSIFMDMDKLFLKEVTSLHDFSSNLVLDRAPKFENHHLRILLEKLATKLSFSNSYHPQKNGQNKIENIALVTMPREIMKANHNSWDEYPFSIEHAYNRVVHKTTNISTFEVVCEHNPLSLFALLPLPKGIMPKEQVTTIENFTKHERIREHMQPSKEKYCKKLPKTKEKQKWKLHKIDLYITASTNSFALFDNSPRWTFDPGGQA
ncbi:uncharacterized protein [Phaseolus vulgaris]|uniref:uncharacterized protein n=1 Tax=Phaseolus vulgaris TaxID=3885 RepID=UPI0035CBEBD1